MKKSLFILALVAVTTSGCSSISSSRLNPLTWFDRASDEGGPVEASPLVPQRKEVAVRDDRVLITRVTSLEVAPVGSGVLVTAQGTTAQSGAYNVDLVPVKIEDGVLTLAFRVQYSSGGTNVRTITSARAFGPADLVGVRQIVVQGQENTLSRRR